MSPQLFSSTFLVRSLYRFSVGSSATIFFGWNFLHAQTAKSPSSRCATVDGFSLHANVAVHADDRPRLERLARYCARAPIAMDRLERLVDGRLLYRFKRPWRDGTTPIVMEPMELLEKLSALVPAPGRYRG